MNGNTSEQLWRWLYRGPASRRSRDLRRGCGTAV